MLEHTQTPPEFLRPRASLAGRKAGVLSGAVASSILSQPSTVAPEKVSVLQRALAIQASGLPSPIHGTGYLRLDSKEQKLK